MRKYLFLLAACTLLLWAAGPAWAAETDTLELDLNATIERALKHSERVKAAGFALESAEISREQAEKDLYITEVNIGMTYTGAAYEASYANLLTSNLSWRMSEKSLTAEQDAVALKACNQYWELKKALVGVDTAMLALQKANADWQKASAFKQVGLITNAEVLGASTALASAKASLEDAEIALEKAYVSFNQMIGLKPDARPVLTEEVVYEPLDPETDVDFLVAKAIADSPAVWQAEQQLDMKTILADLAFYTGDYTPYKIRKIDTQQAELNIATAKDATDTLTRSLYYGIRTLEEKYPAAKQAVELSEENLRVAEAKFRAGMAVRADVVAAQSSLADARQGLMQLEVNHAYLKLALEKPWAYAA
ncbi:MAG: TolC family protein [Pelotomaculum sp.]